jgi:YesN/AraC family two-component response regulator
MEEKIIQDKQENIIQTNNLLDQKLQLLDYTLNSYLQEPLFEQLMQKPLTAEQFDTFHTINNQLNYLANFGPDQTKVEVASIKGNWDISHSSLRQLNDAEKKQIVLKYLPLPFSSTWLKEKSARNEIMLVKQIPLYKKKKYGVVISHFPIQSITNVIQAQANTSTVFIYNKDGTLLYQNNPSKEKVVDQSIVSKVLNENQNQTGIINVNSKESGNYKVAYSKSQYNGWLYVTKIEQSYITSAMESTIIKTIFISLIMLTLTIIIAYFSSDYFSKPIRELQKFIPKNGKDECKDEFEQIGKSIREVIDKNQSLEGIVISQQDQLKTLFILNLFHGRKTETYLEELKYFNYPTKWNSLYVLVFQIDHFDKQDYTKEEKVLLTFSINKLIFEIIPEDEQFSPVAIDSNTQATILICKDEDCLHNQLIIKKYAEEIQKTVKAFFNTAISIGISNPFEKLIESEGAFSEGLEALKYRLTVGKESIIFYENVLDIFNHKQIKLHFPKTLESQLFDAIKSGESTKAKELLHLLLEELFNNSTNPYELEINIMRFLNDLLGLMQLMGMDTFMIENHKTIYNTVSEFKTAEEVENFLKYKLVFPMIETIEERTNSQYKNISDQIVHIIQNEFDTYITLELIASRLHYNPNYLSSIFKKEFKQTFSEYLAQYRYYMAKKWLQETDMSVREIAERLQYNNSQNFIRSFRKQEGTTPGKFREQHRYESVVL